MKNCNFDLMKKLIFDLMKKLIFDLMKFDFLIIPPLTDKLRLEIKINQLRH